MAEILDMLNYSFM